jgi:hypothetical protein
MYTGIQAHTLTNRNPPWLVLDIFEVEIHVVNGVAVLCSVVDVHL